MKNLIRCKACGLIITEKELKKVCPACGVPKSAFEPYSENISKNRKLVLDLHLHPIVVHFPQAFAVFIPAGIILSLLVPIPYNIEFNIVSKILVYFLPLTIVASIATGMIDGKTRFKKLNTPYLVRKMIIASLLLIFSLVMAHIVFWYGLSTTHLPVILLSVGCLGCEYILAQTGVKLMFAVLQG